jgi:iron(III) transport system substrate-binding protein
MRTPSMQKPPRLGRSPGRARSVAVVTLLAIALVATACSSSSSGSSSKPTITLYNGQHEQTTSALVAAFEKKTGINVKVRSDDEAVLVNQIETEGSASPADVLFTENTPALVDLQEKNLLAPIDKSTLAQVPSKYNSDNGDWVGVSARVNVISYNTDELKETQVPTSILDLAQPQWKGKIGLAPTETDFLPVVASVEHTYGHDAALAWLNGLKSNAGSDIYPDNETLINEINLGHVEMGVLNHYYWYRERAEKGAADTHSAIAFFAPHSAGYLIDVAGAGVLASSKEKAASQQFVAFLVSAQGQGIIAHTESYEYPIGSGVTTTKVAVPLSALQPAALTVNQLGDGSQATKLLQQAGLT